MLVDEKLNVNVSQIRLNEIKERLDQIDAENTKMRIANKFMLKILVVLNY